MAVTEQDRFIPSIGNAFWDITKATKEEKARIKSHLVPALTHDENEYRAVLSYLHMKFPDLMDYGYGDGGKFQWRYKTFKNKTIAFDEISRKPFDMYALVYYDASRDMEPVAIGGSYIRKTGAIRDPFTHQIKEDQLLNKHTSQIRCGHGYVLFVDPNYRRLGLARDQWLTEAQLYRDSNVHYQKENQTYAALMVTLSMFADKSKCHILSRTRLENIKESSNTKIIMDYFDPELEKNFENLSDNLKDFRHDFDWRFLDREHLSFDTLLEPWKNIK